MDFLAKSFVVDREREIMMHSFCLLTSMELLPIPNFNLLYLDSNDMNNLKTLFLKKKRVIAIS